MVDVPDDIQMGLCKRLTTVGRLRLALALLEATSVLEYVQSKLSTVLTDCHHVYHSHIPVSHSPIILFAWSSL
jgi:hypothetical protein